LISIWTNIILLKPNLESKFFLNKNCQFQGFYWGSRETLAASFYTHPHAGHVYCSHNLLVGMFSYPISSLECFFVCYRCILLSIWTCTECNIRFGHLCDTITILIVAKKWSTQWPLIAKLLTCILFTRQHVQTLTKNCLPHGRMMYCN
jgi:hypothetical protein